MASTISSLAASLVSLNVDDLSRAARHSTLRCVLDLVGCAAAGRSTPVARAVVEQGTRWAQAALPPGQAGIWFGAATMSVAGAAFVNALAASVLDVDDGHRAASGHPGAAVIPAVVAVGETLGARWDDVLLAIVCGYEAGVSVASAKTRSPASTGATGRWAAVAVAAAIGKLRGLSAAELAHAIAIAEAQAPNMLAADHSGFMGSHIKEGIPWAVLTGIAAAEQAALGFTGYLSGLDNPAAYRPGALPRRSEGDWLIETTYFKPYACCRWTHSAIDAVLALRDGGLEPVAAEAIEVASFQRALSLGNAVRPEDIIAAQFSIPFTVAVALLEGGDALLPMSPALLDRADVIALAERVTLVLDREFEACYPAEVPARVTVKTRHGTVMREVRHPLGSPCCPLSDARLVEKAIRLCQRVRPAKEVRTFAAELLRGTSTRNGADLVRTTLAFIL